VDLYYYEGGPVSAEVLQKGKQASTEKVAAGVEEDLLMDEEDVEEARKKALKAKKKSKE